MGPGRILVERRLGAVGQRKRLLQSCQEPMDAFSHAIASAPRSGSPAASASEAVAMGAALEELERKEAKGRQRAGGKAGGEKAGRGRPAEKVSDNLSETYGHIRTRDRVGAAVGMSGKHYEKAKHEGGLAAKQPEDGFAKRSPKCPDRSQCGDCRGTDGNPPSLTCIASIFIAPFVSGGLLVGTKLSLLRSHLLKNRHFFMFLWRLSRLPLSPRITVPIFLKYQTDSHIVGAVNLADLLWKVECADGALRIGLIGMMVANLRQLSVDAIWAFCLDQVARFFDLQR